MVISASLFLSSLLVSPRRAFTLSILVHLTRPSLFLLSPSFPLSFPSPSLAALSSASGLILRVHLLARSTKRTRHSISPIPSFSLRPFPCASSLSLLLSRLFFLPFFFDFFSPRGAASRTLHRLFARTSTFAPLFPFSLFSVASG